MDAFTGVPGRTPSSPQTPSPRRVGVVHESRASTRRRAALDYERMQRHHDMGGLPAGPIDLDSHPHAPWEKRVNALLTLLARGSTPLFTVDEMRRAIEDLGPAEYDRLGYYERWITAITRILLERGVLTVDGLGRKLAEVSERRMKAAR